MRLVLAISTLGGGGAERVMSTMANYWANEGWDVVLLTLSSPESDFYPLDGRIERIGLGLSGDSHNIFAAVLNNLVSFYTIRKTIRSLDCDAVVSFVDKMNVLCSAVCMTLRTPVVLSERSDPHQHRIGPLLRWLRRLFYARADAVVVQTESAASYFPSRWKTFLSVIPNPIVDSAGGDQVAATLEVRKPCIVGLGRLRYVKGFDLALEAFARLSDRFPDWNLVILGEGSERNALERLTADLGLDDRVSLPGQVRDPVALLRQADVFVLPSRYEGFPNALLEAMACGLPCVSFDCPSGPRDIIRHEANGLLISPGDVAGLADGMARLLEDGELRARLGTAALEVRDRFALEKVMTQWTGVVQKSITR